MDPLKKNRISNTDLFVTSIGFGAATLGNLYKSVEEKQALARNMLHSKLTADEVYMRELGDGNLQEVENENN